MKKIVSKIKTAITKPHLISYKLLRKNREWKPTENELKTKQYSTYPEYLEHQKSKMRKKDIDYKTLTTSRDKKYRQILYNRINHQNIVKPGMNVLCLAARIGTEVKAFHDQGCFAIGIDLEHGKNNKYVVHGDFHKLVFPDQCADAIFTNSLDHAFNTERIIKEAKRVLKAGGHFITEICYGTEEKGDFKYYESTSWGKIEDITQIFEKNGFKIIKETPITYPTPGKEIYFQRK